jgi:hypothetical protein
VTLANMRALARLLGKDSDTYKPVVIDAEVNALLNEAYLWYYAEYSTTLTVWGNVATGFIVGPNYSGGDTSGYRHFVLTTATDISRIDNLLYSTTSGGTTTGTPVKRVGMDEMVTRNSLLAAPSQGDVGPSEYAAARLISGGWLFLFDRGFGKTTGPVNFYFDIEGKAEVAVMAVDGSIPDLRPEECNAVCRLAAAEVARLAGHGPDVVSEIVAGLPDYVKVSNFLNAAEKVGKGA